MHTSPRRRANVLLPLTFAALVAALLLAFPAVLASAQTISLSRSSTRSAGTGTAAYTGDLGTAAATGLNSPSYLVFDAAGNQYLSDTLNNCVRRTDAAGNISTIAGLAVPGEPDTCDAASNPSPTPAQGLFQPSGLALDPAGRLYIADTQHHCIRMLPSGLSGVSSLITVAGTCGSASSSSVTPSPNGLALDPAGDLYISVADNTSTLPVNQVVRHAADASVPTVCLVAGAPSANVALPCGNPNGVTLSHPSGLAFDVAGNLFLADTGNNCVREIAGNTISTAVGRCLNDGSGSASVTLGSPYGLAFSPTETLFLTESAPDNVVSYIPGAPSATVVAGTTPGGIAVPYSPSQDGTSALTITLNAPRGLAFDNLGNLVLADSGNNIARTLSTNDLLPPIAVGAASASLPLTFLLSQSVNLSVSPSPALDVTSNSCTGAIHPGASATTCQVFVRFTPTSPGRRTASLRLSDSVSGATFTFGLERTATGALSLFTPGLVSTVATHLASNSSLAANASGNILVLENTSSSGLSLVPATGGPARNLLSTGLITPTASAQDAAGNLFVADATHNLIARFGVDGSVDTAFLTGLDTPQAIAVDNFGNLFIAQAGSTHNVIEAYVSGTRRVVAGSGSNLAADGLPAVTAKLLAPSALALDRNHTLYIADSAAHLVFAVDNTGNIHVLAGNGSTSTSAAGQATGTALLDPVALAVDAAGDLYIADKAANLVDVVYASSTSGSNIATALGTGAPGSLGDGGLAPLAQVNAPASLALDGSGNLFVLDSGASSVRQINFASPVSLDLGSTNVGQTSATGTQSILNAGTADLLLTSPVVLSDPHFTVDASSSTCATSLPSGSLCSLAFHLTPTAAVAYTATATLALNAVTSAPSIQLKGLGRQLLTPQLLLPSQTEVYGQSFALGAIFTNAGATAPTGTVTFSSNGTNLCSLSATFTNGAVTCTAASTGLPVGTYPVTFTYTGDGSFAPASATLSLTVTPQPLNELVNSTSRAFGNPNPVFTGKLLGVANNDTILVSFTTSANPASTIGVYPITATLTPIGSASLSNYTVLNVPGSLTINPAALTLTVASTTRTYGSANPVLSSTTATSTDLGGLAITYTTSANPTSPVGTYPVTATVSGAAALNVTLSIIPGTLTITPAPLTATVNNATRSYGQPNPGLTSRLTGVLNGDTFDERLGTTATAGSPAGTYPITDTLSGASIANYAVKVLPGTLSITQNILGLSLPAQTEVYGQTFPETVALTAGNGAAPTGTLTFTSAGKILCSTTGSFAASIVLCNAASSGLHVGSYTVSVSYTGDSNYAAATGNTVLLVTPATLLVKANDASRAFGSPNPALSGSLSGLIAGDTVSATYTTSAVQNSPAGTYAIVPVVSSVSDNYNVVLGNGNLTVTPGPKALLVQVNNASRLFGASNPNLSGTVSGMLPGDDIAVTYTTSASTSSNSGTYPINATLSGASASNYAMTVQPGTLTVSPAPTVTILSTSAATAVAGSSITLTANVTGPVANLTGTVAFTDGANLLGTANINGAGVANLTLANLSAGQHNLSAAFAASPNLLGSSASLTQQIDTPTGSFTLAATPAVPSTQRIPGTTVYQVTLSSVGAFHGPIALTCNGLPADATCAFSNSTPNLGTGGTVTTSMTVTSTLADAHLAPPSALHPTQLAALHLNQLAAAAVFPFELPLFGILFAKPRRSNHAGAAPSHRTRLNLVLLFTVGVLGLTGCGAPVTTTAATTAARTYTINITASSTSFAAPTQTTSVLLSVGQTQ